MLILLLLLQSLPMIEENTVPPEPIESIQLVEEESSLKVSIVVGGISSLGSQDSYSISPTAAIETEGALAKSEYAPKLHVHASLTSLPEESISLQDARTFKALEFEAGFEQGIPSIYPRLYGGFGIATRLPGDKSPRVSAAKYFTFGVRFATKDNSSYLYVGGGPDQRLDSRGYWAVSAHIEGQVKLAAYKDAKLSLKGNAILGGSSSLVRIGVVVGI